MILKPNTLPSLFHRNLLQTAHSHSLIVRAWHSLWPTGIIASNDALATSKLFKYFWKRFRKEIVKDFIKYKRYCSKLLDIYCQVYPSKPVFTTFIMKIIYIGKNIKKKNQPAFYRRDANKCKKFKPKFTP
jgi:hypothetical protein